ncbi:hypothetical protein Francci3_2778 [Frankia casuarinae]|uniref:Uncharacterized protein n=1 Tax=Frankia casuarinae (strain DSM 45818 / CECT 9043 / HFP020203 / CcI3) TaxID=106370 RepID=Q2J9A5_FRACC|nr:hypothetical protein Francci3_2778 [Frankia casuarinae]
MSRGGGRAALLEIGDGPGLGFVTELRPSRAGTPSGGRLDTGRGSAGAAWVDRTIRRGRHGIRDRSGRRRRPYPLGVVSCCRIGV